MHDLFALPGGFYQFQRDVVILEPRQAGPQALHPHRERKAHLQPGVKTVQIGQVIVQRPLHHLETERFLGVFVKAAHDPGHVDALFASLKAHGAGDTGFQRQHLAIAGLKRDRQPEIADADMLNLLPRAPDQAGGAIL